MSARFTIGTDLVYVPAFAEQLSQPGTTFMRVFSESEQRVAAGYPEGPRRAAHLAGRWAVKEAFIKAWSQARYGLVPVMEEEKVVWRDIVTRPDPWGRPKVDIAGELRRAVDASLGPWHAEVSISHDGDYAQATCLLQVD